MKTLRLTLAALGTTAMGYGLWSALRSPDLVPSRNATFLLLLVVLHDGLLMPAFVAAGMLVHRLVPPPVRAVVQAALIATASVTLVALPLALGYGRIADNRSALPRDYPAGLLLTLAAIWTAAAVAAVIAVRGRPRGDPAGPAGADPVPHPPDPAPAPPPNGSAGLEFPGVSGRRNAR